MVTTDDGWGGTIVMTAPTPSPVKHDWPPPALTDDQYNKLMNLHVRHGFAIEQAFKVLEVEKTCQTGPPPNPTATYKAPPAQRIMAPHPASTQDTVKKYGEVIAAKLLMQIPDPNLKDIEFDKLSAT